MRQTKFRAWDYDNKEMLYPKHDGCFEVQSGTRFAIGGTGKLMSVYIEKPVIKKPKLLQYTGLKDKNGQEIYEGDIIGVTHYFIDEGGEWEWESKHEVVWGGEDYPAFELKPSLECECNGLSYLKCNPEVEMYAVIGNIHENEDLL